MLAERLSRLDGREKFGLLVVVLAIVLLILDWAVIRPINTRCRALDVDIERESKALAYQESVLQAGPQVDRQFTDIRERLGTAMPPAEALEVMKGEIDRLAQESEVSLIATKHRDPRHAEFYDEYALDIGDFETDEEGVARFLHAIMTAPGTFRVTRLKIAPDNTGKRVKGSMTVTKVTAAADETPPQPPQS